MIVGKFVWMSVMTRSGFGGGRRPTMVSSDRLATRWRTIWFDGSTDARYQPLLTR
jgi:hypothetical protein